MRAALNSTLLNLDISAAQLSPPPIKREVPALELKSVWRQQSVWIMYSLIHAHSYGPVKSKSLTKSIRYESCGMCTHVMCVCVWACIISCHVMLARLLDSQIFSHCVEWNWTLVRLHFSGNWAQDFVAHLCWHSHSTLTKTNPSVLFKNKRTTVLQ